MDQIVKILYLKLAGKYKKMKRIFMVNFYKRKIKMIALELNKNYKCKRDIR